MLPQPDSLARVLRQHGALAGEGRRNIDHEIRRHQPALAISAFDRVHEVQMRDPVEWRLWRLHPREVVRRRRPEAGVAHQRAGGFVVAKVIHRRRRQHQVRTGLPQGFRDPAPRRIVGENRQVPHLQAKIPGANQRRRIGRFLPANGRDFLRAQMPGAAVARGEGGDGDRVAQAGQQRQRTAGQNLHIVRMRVDREDGCHSCSCSARPQMRRTRMCWYSVHRPASCACSSMGPSSRFSSRSYSITVSPLIRPRHVYL